ncbi:MAG TPA: hypothetical protein VFJ70_12170 [Burkholderiales bacterium]|nr:hypothetical protein [Burkholderiales bacterium]
MADERDPQISQRYRALGGEEPPPELDRAILAAARRATTRRNRWYPSLAAAAVLVFAVAIVVQVERQPPDQAPMSEPSPPAVAAPAQDKVAPQERKAPAAAPAKPAAGRRAEQAPQFAPEPAPAPPPAPSANVAAPAAGVGAEGERKRADETRAAPQLQRSMGAQRSAASAALRDEVPPDEWLTRIARLRELGRDEEADKELARFRERYPDYRIPEVMAKKVEKQAPAAPAR